MLSEPNPCRTSDGRSFLRAAAGSLALTFALLSGLLFTTQTAAHAAPLLVVPAASAALPFSVVSAGVGGGAFVISTGGAIASAGITAAAALGAHFGIKALFEWNNDTPATYGDPPPTGGTPSGCWGSIVTSGCTQAWSTPDHNYVMTAAPAAGRYTPPRASTGLSVTITAKTGSNAISRIHVQCYSSGSLSTYGAAAGSTFVFPTIPSGSSATWTIPAGSMCTDGYGPDSFGFSTGSTTSFRATYRAGSNYVAPSPSVAPGTTPLLVTPVSKCVTSGGAVSTVNGTPVEVTRAGTQQLAVVYPACPSGTTLTERSAPVTRKSDGVLVGQSHDPWSPPPVPAIYPDCSDRTCVMTLTQTDPAGRTQTCGGPNACTSYGEVVKTWPQVGSSAFTGPRTAPDGMSYQCKFGPYPVAAAECQVIPGVGLTPTAQQSESNCNLSDFSWNPISWIVVPLKCLFIPRDAQVQAAASAIGTAWDGTAPATVFDAFEDVGAPVVALKDTPAQGCAGPPFTFPALAGVTDPFTIHPLSTCNELTQYLLGIWMPLHTAFVYLGGFFAGTRLLLKTVNVESPVQA